MGIVADSWIVRSTRSGAFETNFVVKVSQTKVDGMNKWISFHAAKLPPFLQEKNRRLLHRCAILTFKLDVKMRVAWYIAAADQFSLSGHMVVHVTQKAKSK